MSHVSSIPRPYHDTTNLFGSPFVRAACLRLDVKIENVPMLDPLSGQIVISNVFCRAPTLTPPSLPQFLQFFKDAFMPVPAHCAVITLTVRLLTAVAPGRRRRYSSPSPEPWHQGSTRS